MGQQAGEQESGGWGGARPAKEVDSSGRAAAPRPWVWADLVHRLSQVRLLLYSLTAVLLLAAITALAALLCTAASDRALVVAAMAVAPDVAERQITGEALAGLLADRLATIDARARSVRAARSFALDWRGEIRREASPDGGSAAWLHALGRMLGRPTRIEGTLYHEGDRLALSLRAGGGEAIVVAGEATRMDELVRRAAEGAYARLQPYRYSRYLQFEGRSAEALAVAQDLAAEGPPGERAWAWAQVSELLQAGDPAAAQAAAQHCQQLDPDLWLGYLEGSMPLAFLDRAQEAHDLLALARARTGRGEVDRLGLQTMAVYAGEQLAYEGDAPGAARAFDPRGRDALPGLEPMLLRRWSEALAEAHDVSASLRAEEWSGATAGRRLPWAFRLPSPAFARAAALEDWPAAVEVAQQELAALDASTEVAERSRPARQRWILPRLAWALAHAGRLDEARRWLAELPQDCYRCQIARGWIEGTGGDLEAAGAAFREALRRNPTLPHADLAWGRLLLAHGNWGEAMAHFARAAQLGPRFADPLKYWADVLAPQGRTEEALSKYAQAADRAPRWGGLQLAWAQAAWQAGRRPLAQSRLAWAAGLDLSAGERAALEHLQESMR